VRQQEENPVLPAATA